MKTTNQLIALAAVLLIGLGFGWGQFNQVTASAPPTPTKTPRLNPASNLGPMATGYTYLPILMRAPKPTPIPTATPTPFSYYYEDFSGPRHDGWPEVDLDGCESDWGWEDGGDVYKIRIDDNHEDDPYFRNADRAANRQTGGFEVDMKRYDHDSSRRFEYGLYINGRGGGEYYLFFIDFKYSRYCGEWRLIRREDSRNRLLAQGDCRDIYGDIRYNDKNTLKIFRENDGSRVLLHLYINGERADIYADRDPLWRGVATGVYIRPRDDDRVRVYFDNFLVTPY